MTELVILDALVAGLTAALVALVYLFSEEKRAHTTERARWEKERERLLERLVPGLDLRDEASVTRVPAYGTNSYEYAVERERLRGDAS